MKNKVIAKRRSIGTFVLYMEIESARSLLGVALFLLPFEIGIYKIVCAHPKG